MSIEQNTEAEDKRIEAVMHAVADALAQRHPGHSWVAVGEVAARAAFAWQPGDAGRNSVDAGTEAADRYAWLYERDRLLVHGALEREIVLDPEGRAA